MISGKSRSLNHGLDLGAVSLYRNPWRGFWTHGEIGVLHKAVIGMKLLCNWPNWLRSQQINTNSESASTTQGFLSTFPILSQCNWRGELRFWYYLKFKHSVDTATTIFEGAEVPMVLVWQSVDSLVEFYIFVCCRVSNLCLKTPIDLSQIGGPKISVLYRFFTIATVCEMVVPCGTLIRLRTSLTVPWFFRYKNNQK